MVEIDTIKAAFWNDFPEDSPYDCLMRAKSFLFAVVLSALYLGVAISVGLWRPKAEPDHRDTSVQAWWKDVESRLPK
ncbi:MULTISPECIES: hypothetical protein [unclassified Bradyrhizobium]|uniref:hypothetical protein n=1 Tax=unclassified Bradyrhizobium TaxID=2631580 RepID=UPI0028EA4F39|nr:MULTISPECIES: hypothetical protein [unclassified Bradyrhizobium]